MSVLHDFAEFFKVRKTPVRSWFEDGVGKWAFLVDVKGQAFVCCARKSRPSGGTTSVMKRVAGRAQTRDAFIALRLPDDEIHVFDPVSVLAKGDFDQPHESDRKERGEEWVEMPLSLACTFEEWYDGRGEPVSFADVESF